MSLWGFLGVFVAVYGYDYVEQNEKDPETRGWWKGWFASSAVASSIILLAELTEKKM
jgi:hypothetical protein